MMNSGMSSEVPLRAMLDTMPIDRVCFSIDYRFDPNESGKEFLDSITILDKEQKELFAHGNLDKLLGLQ
jgi:hypothetical protein